MPDSEEIPEWVPAGEEDLYREFIAKVNAAKDEMMFWNIVEATRADDNATTSFPA